MNSRILVVFLVSFVLAFPPSSSAHVGTLEEVFKAAWDDAESEFIKDWRKQFFQKILTLARDRDIHSPEQMLALLVTMIATTRVTRNAALDDAWYASGSGVLEVARADWQTTDSAIRRAVFEAYYLPARRVAENTAWEFFVPMAHVEIVEVVVEFAYANGATSAQANRIAYRTAEWLRLNDILNHPTMLGATYTAVLDNFRRHSEINPSEILDNWMGFRNRYAADLSPRASVHLDPWFDLFELLFAQERALILMHFSTEPNSLIFALAWMIAVHQVVHKS